MEDIFSYTEMCRREGDASLQRGMNFELGGNYSVILMSRATNAPYRDRFEDNDSVLIYEGHDASKTKALPDPKLVDQPERTPYGTLTQNGRFLLAAEEYKSKKRSAERVKVYEKIRPGIWTYNGVFHLTDSKKENDGKRSVFMFRLEAISGDEDFSKPISKVLKHRRIIPTWVKRKVWQRDGAKCVQCGKTDNLHFDHILPFSKGGTSITPDNVQILCARHNIQKSDDII